MSTWIVEKKPWTSPLLISSREGKDKIAHVLNGDVGIQKMKENANLIAAAPDLFTALERIKDLGTRMMRLDHVTTDTDLALYFDAADRIAREAIAKAKGDFPK